MRDKKVTKEMDSWHSWLRKKGALIEMEPKAGTHEVHCFMCGKLFSEVQHKGGDKRLKRCKYCQDIGHYCFDCYEK